MKATSTKAESVYHLLLTIMPALQCSLFRFKAVILVMDICTVTKIRSGPMGTTSPAGLTLPTPVKLLHIQGLFLGDWLINVRVRSRAIAEIKLAQ